MNERDQNSAEAKAVDGRETTKAQPTARGRRHKLGLAVPAFALVVAALASSATPAAAYTESKSAYAGYVGALPAQGYVYSRINEIGITRALRIPAHVVGPSQAYSNRGQWACQTTRLWAINSSSWVVAASDYRCLWIAAGEIGVIFAAFDFAPLSYNVGYSVDVTTTWHLANHNQIARSYIDYRHLADYQCVGNGNCYKDRSNWAGAFIYFL